MAQEGPGVRQVALIKVDGLASTLGSVGRRSLVCRDASRCPTWLAVKLRMAICLAWSWRWATALIAEDHTDWPAARGRIDD